MTWFDFLSDRLGRLVLALLSAGLAAVVLLATGTQGGVLALVLLMLGVGYVLVLLWDFWHQRRRLRQLQATLDGLDRKWLLYECAPPPAGAWEREMFRLLRRAGRAMTGAVSDARQAQQEYREYVEQWVHEIKTPLTAAHLICQGLEPGIRRRLEAELAQIDAHAQRALYYARAQSPEKDLVIRRVTLAQAADRAVQGHRALLIQSGVGVEMEGLERTVYTDEKALVFVLGQLLQNAARYRREEGAARIALSAREREGRVELTVVDNGMGIAPHELPRIFDRGFTGSNGRARGGSTGMGLYLVKQLADALEIGLRADAREGEGTRVTLTFLAPQGERAAAPGPGR